MSSSDLVEGYASALFEVARAEGSLEAVENELFQFSNALRTSDELRQTLTDAAIPADRRQAIVEDLLGRGASPATTNLVSFIVGSGRSRQLSEIVDRLVERAAAERQHVVAEVRTAIPLDDDQRRRLAEALGKSLGKQVEVKAIVDPSVIGGVHARVGDTVIDGTIRHRLDKLREQF